MEIPELVFAALTRRAPDAVCDRCLTLTVLDSATVLSAVNVTARALALTVEFERLQEACSDCGSTKQVTRRVAQLSGGPMP
jgi:hypothetical protein